MSAKDGVLKILEQNRGETLSGEAIAGELGVSRNAVWKAVRALRDEGHPIECEANRGYRLSSNSTVLSEASVRRYLGNEPWFHIETAGEVTSTNAILKTRAAAGAPEGTVLIADSQTQGHGRQGRAFASPQKSGLYMSILLRPTMRAQEALFLTTATAVAVAEGIETVSGKAAGIKWVNDIWLGTLKVCGILTEASFDLEGGGLEYAVVGLGINVTEPDGGFPPEIQGIAGAVFGAGETPAPDVKSRLAAEILSRFLHYYRTFAERTFWQGYRERSIVLGRDITILGNPPRHAVALDIDDECRLRVRLDDGSEALLSSGEVSVRPSTR